MSEERKELEIIALKRVGFITEGLGGRSIPPSVECWGISMITRLHNNDLLTISFRCDSYPYRPPKVYCFSKEHGKQEFQASMTSFPISTEGLEAVSLNISVSPYPPL